MHFGSQSVLINSIVPNQPSVEGSCFPSLETVMSMDSPCAVLKAVLRQEMEPFAGFVRGTIEITAHVQASLLDMLA